MQLDKINRREALDYLGYHGSEPDSRILALIEKYEKQLLGCISPRYYFKIITKDSPILMGRDIAEHLKNSSKAAVFAATIGIRADNLLRTVQVVDMTGAVVLDALMGSAVESVCDAAEREIAALFPDNKLTTRFSPGYGDYPLEVQPDLLGLLSAEKRLGITVNDSGMMTPAKSVTAVIGIDREGINRYGF